jgi:thymidylate synthase
MNTPANMNNYYGLAYNILQNGDDSDDRTKVGTLSSFGDQLRFDLRKGFPLLTGKFVPFDLIRAELLFFLSGSTNNEYLRKLNGNNNPTIWEEWSDKNGNLGPIYSHQWRNFGGKIGSVPQPTPRIDSGFSTTVYGVASVGFYEKGTSDILDKLLTLWKGMVARCYRVENDNYSYYGGKGVSVCDRWLTFSNFMEDAMSLPNWSGKIGDWDGIQLDKDIVGDGFTYSPSSCVWASKEDNMRAVSDKQWWVKHDDGREDTFVCQADFISDNGLNQGNFSAMLRGERAVCQGWRLVKYVDKSVGVDQIKVLVDGLKKDPSSRRHIVSAWNVSDLNRMCLSPCHAAVQFRTRKLTLVERTDLADSCVMVHAPTGGANAMVMHSFLDEHNVPRYALQCQMYQRSADLFLGAPFNIASYALLTNMVAQVVNMVPEKLIVTFGDVHIYKNHIDQVRELLRRDFNHFPLPTLRLNPTVQDIDDFTAEDIVLEGYQSYPAIKAPVAV